MQKQDLHHSTFSLERVYDAAPTRVFAAFSEPGAKAKWFAGGSDWRPEIREMDFRVGGNERARGIWDNGRTSDFRARYHVIVPNERIIYVYDMYVDDRLLSVSVATIDISPAGRGTRLVITEQGVFFGNDEDARSREEGTKHLLERLGASLRD